MATPYYLHPSMASDGQFHSALKRVILFEDDDDWLADSLSDDGSFELGAFALLPSARVRCDTLQFR